MADPLAPQPLPEIEVDPAAVAQALGLSLRVFQQLMDSGRIRTLSERGTGAEFGQYRLSFWHGERRYRIVTDAAGHVLSREAR
ncbi:DUF6522 family protein [Xanthomonadaceae bacterium JHOS43]|nr:DUF6522 family protein [Xanthomonadaceae bacterium JHOS43]MCX7562509.1 DUF6522 family protein [Xanthomonadaceae bacterium XH05]